MARQERRPALLLDRERRRLENRGSGKNSPMPRRVFVLLIVGLVGTLLVLFTRLLLSLLKDLNRRRKRRR
jgi:hypothetical protein